MRSYTPAALLLMLAVAAATCYTPTTAVVCSFDINPSVQPPGKCMDMKGLSRDEHNYGYCAPKIQENCEDSANYACRVCSLYFIAHDELCADKSGGKPADTQHCITSSAPTHSPVKGDQTTIQIATADVKSRTKHWKIVPKFAIRGNEDIGSKVADDLKKLWIDGVAALGSLPFGPSTTLMHLDTTGFVNNGPAVRTNHQLHIHIGAINPSFKSTYLSKAPAKYKQGHWFVLDSDTKHKIIIKCSSSMDAFSEYSSALGSTEWPHTYTVSGLQYDARYHTTIMLVKGPSWSSSPFCTILLRNKGDADLLTY